MSRATGVNLNSQAPVIMLRRERLRRTFSRRAGMRLAPPPRQNSLPTARETGTERVWGGGWERKDEI